MKIERMYLILFFIVLVIILIILDKLFFFYVWKYKKKYINYLLNIFMYVINLCLLGYDIITIMVY